MAAAANYDEMALARIQQGQPDISDAQVMKAEISLPSAALKWGFCQMRVDTTPGWPRLLEQLKEWQPTKRQLQKPGAHISISGNVQQYDLSLATGDVANAARAALKSFGPTLASLIQTAYQLDAKPELCAQKLLCAPPLAPKQIYHADAAKGFAERARFFTVLIHVTTGHQSTQLPLFPLSALPSPVEISEAGAVDSLVQRQMLQQLLPVYFDPQHYTSFQQDAGRGIVLDQRVFHAGPANNSGRERRMLFLMFRAPDAVVQQGAEQQLYEWVMTEWAHGPTSRQLADCIVKYKKEDVLGRIDEPWQPHYIRLLKYHNRMNAYLQDNPVDEQTQLLIDSIETPKTEQDITSPQLDASDELMVSDS